MDTVRDVPGTTRVSVRVLVKYYVLPLLIQFLVGGLSASARPSLFARNSSLLLLGT
jgi:hypothetical protein